MTSDYAFISEVWAAIKEHVDDSQYLDICDRLVELFDSYNTSDGFTTEVEFDQPLFLAVNSYFELDEESEVDEYDE